MDEYTPVLRRFFRLLGELWLRRIAAELQQFAEALDQWLHDLFSHPTADWRTRFDQFLAAQESAGRMVERQSRHELLDFLDGWAETVDWNSVHDGRPVDDPNELVAAAPEGTGWQTRSPENLPDFHRRDSGRTLSGGAVLFWRKLQVAEHQLDEMRKVLEALGRRLDATKLDEPIDVESEVDAIENLIWRFNAALETARDVWLSDGLSSRAYERLGEISSPVAFGLPRFVDERQAARATQQIKQIGRRSGRTLAIFDYTISGMKVAEAAGTAASYALGAGVVLKAAQQGGKWAVVKTVAKVAASGAAAYGVGEGVEHGLRAAGASEEMTHGVSLAAEVVTWLLLLRRVRTARAEATPRPRNPVSPRQPPAGGSGTRISQGEGVVSTPPERIPTGRTRTGTKTGPRPGSVSGNPANRSIETGVPTKKGGWVRRWIRITEADYRRWLQERREFYDHVDDLADRMRLSPAEARRFRFEQMRRWRTDWLRTFLENRDY